MGVVTAVAYCPHSHQPVAGAADDVFAAGTEGGTDVKGAPIMADEGAAITVVVVPIMSTVIMSTVIMSTVIMSTVIMSTVIMPTVIMSTVIMPTVPTLALRLALVLALMLALLVRMLSLAFTAWKMSRAW
jgi:hypothetical protein